MQQIAAYISAALVPWITKAEQSKQGKKKLTLISYLYSECL